MHCQKKPKEQPVKTELIIAATLAGRIALAATYPIVDRPMKFLWRVFISIGLVSNSPLPFGGRLAIFREFSWNSVLRVHAPRPFSLDCPRRARPDPVAVARWGIEDGIPHECLTPDQSARAQEYSPDQNVEGSKPGIRLGRPRLGCPLDPEPMSSAESSLSPDRA